MFFFTKNLFVPPPRVRLENYSYMPHAGIDTYSDYNYLRPGLAGRLRTLHFEHALRLTRQYFHKSNVIDFACGDGPFIPSLSKYFNHVAAIDQITVFTEIAARVVEKAGLRNVSVLSNANRTIDQTRTSLGTRRYDILFLLEALEHIADRDNPWTSRMGFLEQLSSLVSRDGILVVSVPNMVGMSLLLQRLGMTLLRQDREPLSTSDFLKASFLNETSGLEKRWAGGHLGFNHLKLEDHLRRKFTILKRKNIFWQVIYVLKPRAG